MNVFKLAQQMELDGKALYKEQLQKTTNPGLKKILQMLILQEEDHYKFFVAMEENDQNNVVHHHSFDGIKTIFEEMNKADSFPNDSVDFYERVHKIELDSEQYYRQLAKEQKNELVKKQILTIAAEEHKHAILLQDILEMIRRPHSWVENAEFYKLEDY